MDTPNSSGYPPNVCGSIFDDLFVYDIIIIVRRSVSPETPIHSIVPSAAAKRAADNKFSGEKICRTGLCRSVPLTVCIYTVFFLSFFFFFFTLIEHVYCSFSIFHRVNDIPVRTSKGEVEWYIIPRTIFFTVKIPITLFSSNYSNSRMSLVVVPRYE